MEKVYYTPDRVNMRAGMIAGFIASAISGLVLAGATAFALAPEFDFVTVQGSIFGLAQNIIAAWMVYFIIGTFLWGTIYAAAQKRLTNTHPVGKGLLFGLFIWFIVMIILMPMADAGAFLQEYGITAAIVVLVTDLIFGMILGFFYNILNRRYEKISI